MGTGIAKIIGIERQVDLFKLRGRYNRYKKKISQEVSNIGEPKFFVIGFNKTGTTTIESALKELNFRLGDQSISEYLTRDIIRNSNYKKLFEYCKTSQAFQDIPFSLPGVYKKLDEEFPNSKFILTVRDSSDQWYKSMCKFYGKISYSDSSKPTRESLKNCGYRYKGFLFDVFDFFYPSKDLFSEEYKSIYEKHIEEVKEYFSNRESQLIVINVSEEKGYKGLCSFLDVDPVRDSFKWENKT